MISSWTIILITANLVLMAVLLMLPLGRRTISITRDVAASPDRVWQALFPFGDSAGWSGKVKSVRQVSASSAWQSVDWRGRDDQPVDRLIELSDVAEGESFKLRVVEDTVLDQAFWRDYSEGVEIEALPDGGARVTQTRTDRYRGAAFLVFRYFLLRREMKQLQSWTETGDIGKPGLVFEHPISQIGIALFSVLLLWPVFGLSMGGLVAACTFILVIVLHEFGHVVAFRIMGHRQARIIILPLVGGLAIGGRPYDRQYEVAFVALMGPGLSAALVGLTVAVAACVSIAGHDGLALVLAAVAGGMALFNIANLLPFWRLDGAQVLRQISQSWLGRAFGALVLVSPVLGLGYSFSGSVSGLLVSAACAVGLALIPQRHGVRLRQALKPIEGRERVLIATGLLAVVLLHSAGLYWAAEQLRQIL